MNDTERKLALEILDEAIKITIETEYDIFVEYEGNMNWVRVSYYDLSGEPFLAPDIAECEDGLKAVLQKLAELRES